MKTPSFEAAGIAGNRPVGMGEWIGLLGRFSCLPLPYFEQNFYFVQSIVSHKMNRPTPLLPYPQARPQNSPVKSFIGFLKHASQLQYCNTPPNINSPISAHPISAHKSNTAFEISRRIAKTFAYLNRRPIFHICKFQRKGAAIMGLIPCTSRCIYQKDGLCELDCAAVAGLPPADGGCVHFIPACVRPLEGPHQYSARESTQAPEMPESAENGALGSGSV